MSGEEKKKKMHESSSLEYLIADTRSSKALQFWHWVQQYPEGGSSA